MPGGEAVQSLCLSVDEGGALEYLSHAVIPFRDAALRQRVRIEVASGGSLIYADVLSLGRVQSGERLMFRSVSMELTVRRAVGPELYIESYRLEPVDGLLDAPGILGPRGTGAVGTLIAVTDADTPGELCSAVRRVADDSTCHLAASPLPAGGGIVVKVLTGSASDAESLLRHAARALQIPPAVTVERDSVPARPKN
jgi:urease accessory protein UreH